MSEISYNGAMQNAICEAPVPLLIGKLPFNNLTSGLHEYNYKKYYIIDHLLLSGGLVSFDPMGYLMYNEYLNNYVICNVRLQKFYPHFEGQYSYDTLGYQSKYYLNPFVNDLNGICSFVTDDFACQKKIAYNSQTNKFDLTYSIEGDFDYGTLYGTRSNSYESVSFFELHSQLTSVSSWTDYSHIRNFYGGGDYIRSIDNLPSSYTTIDFRHEFVPPLTSQSYWSVARQFSYSFDLNSNSTSIFFKTNELTNLDQSDVPIGLYKTLSGDFYAVIGSLVLKGEGTSKLIGNNFPTYHETSNKRKDVFNTPSAINAYWYIGSSYDKNEDKMHLVQIITDYYQNIDQNTPYRNYRYILLKGKSYDPFNYNQFWYWDPPQNKIQTLFATSTRWNNEWINEYTFSPYGDASGTKLLQCYGVTSRQASDAKFGRIQTTGNRSTKIYIGNWLTPQAEFE